MNYMLISRISLLAFLLVATTSNAQKLSIIYHVVFRKSPASVKFGFLFKNGKLIEKTLFTPGTRNKNAKTSINLDDNGPIEQIFCSALLNPALLNGLVTTANKLIGSGKPDLTLMYENKQKHEAHYVAPIGGQTIKFVLTRKGDKKPNFNINRTQKDANGIETATDNATFYFWKQSK